MKKEIYDSYYYDGRKKRWKIENFWDGCPPKPSPEVIEEWKINWENTEGNMEQERALKKLFTELLPQNSDLEDVLLKLAPLMISTVLTFIMFFLLRKLLKI